MTHSNNGSSEYELALAAPKVKDSTDEEVKQVLRFAMILIGIRAATISSMDAEEKQILIMFLKSKFGYFTLDEIKIAFTKACAGELDVDARPFENFTCEYIGRIMKAYHEWAKDEKLKIESRERIRIQNRIEDPTPSDCIELCDVYYQEFLNDDFNFITATTLAWDRIKKRFDIHFTKEKNNEIIDQAKAIYFDSRKSFLENAESKGGIYNAMLKSYNRDVNKSNEELLSIIDIKNYCKRIGLNEWFKTLKEQNIKSIFEYEKLQTN